MTLLVNQFPLLLQIHTFYFTLQSCQADLVRDGCHRYFIAMVGDVSLPFEQRTMAAFVLTNIVRNYRPGQQAALQANSIAVCLEALGLGFSIFIIQIR